jgi:hypothetical protein
MNIQQLQLVYNRAETEPERKVASEAIHAHWRMVFASQSLVLLHLTDAERAPKYFYLAGMERYAGFSFVACEAMVALLGSEYDIEVLKIYRNGDPHYVLLFADGTILDPTNPVEDQNDFPAGMKENAERATVPEYPSKASRAVLKRIAFRILKGL